MLKAKLTKVKKEERKKIKKKLKETAAEKDD